MLKSWLRAVLATRRLELTRLPKHVPVGRQTQLGALKHVVSQGLAVATVFDVGAAHGTASLLTAFPKAKHVWIEPLSEFEKPLRNLSRNFDADVIIAAAGRADGQITLNVHPDLYGSSALLEEEVGNTNGAPRHVSQITLDALATQNSYVGPFFLKLDTQGYELAVLEGATSLLEKTAAILVEVSLFQFFSAGPTMATVVERLDEWGFSPHDIVEPHYRPLDAALAQVDIMFLPRDSPLRSDNRYADESQRAKQFSDTS